MEFSLCYNLKFANTFNLFNPTEFIAYTYLMSSRKRIEKNNIISLAKTRFRNHVIKLFFQRLLILFCKKIFFAFTSLNLNHAHFLSVSTRSDLGFESKPNFTGFGWYSGSALFSRSEANPNDWLENFLEK